MFNPRPLFAALVLCALPVGVSAAAPGAAVPSGETATNPAVAVLDFGGGDSDLGTAVAEAVCAALGEYEDLSVVECSDVRDACAQLKLSTKNPLDAHQAQRLGKIVAAGRLIVGSCAIQGEEMTLTARVLDAQPGAPAAEISETVSGSREYLEVQAHRLAHHLHQRLMGRGPCPETYTGLMVDARALAVQRAMGPRILDEEKRVIYPVSPRHVPSTEVLQAKGMAAYISTESAAPRSGDMRWWCRRSRCRDLRVKTWSFPGRQRSSFCRRTSAAGSWRAAR